MIAGLMKRRFIECECEPERVNEERGGAVRERDISGSDSCERETSSNRHEQS